MGVKHRRNRQETAWRYPGPRTLLTCAFLSFGAGSAYGETLRQAVETAVKSHPKVLAADAQRRAVIQDRNQARGGYFPSVDVTYANGRERTESPDVRVTGVDSASLNRREAGVIVSQNLFAGGGTVSEVERQSALIEVATNRLAESREEIGLKTIEAYLEVLKNRELVRLAQDNMKAHFETRDKVRQRVQGGVSQKADLQQALARVALAASALSARWGRLREVEANYVSTVGRAPADLSDPPPTSTQTLIAGTIDPTRLTESIRRNSELAVTTNPTLNAANAQIAAAEASVRGAKAPYFPRLNLEYTTNRNDNIGGTRGPSDNDALMLVLRWNLFRGGSDRAAERAFAERRYAAIDFAADTRRTVEERVALALYAKATSEERMAYLQEHASLSFEVLDSYKQQLDLGRRSLLDVLNAENELFTARSNLVAGRYDDLFNQYAIEAAKGTLVKSLGIVPAD